MTATGTPLAADLQLRLARRALRAAELAFRAHNGSQPARVAFWACFDAYEVALVAAMAQTDRPLGGLEWRREPGAPGFLELDVPDDGYWAQELPHGD